MGRRVPAIVLTLAAAALLATGCQQKPPIKIEPTTAPSESQPPAPPKKPALPTKAKRDDYAGAVAFVNYYYKLAAFGEKTDIWEPLQKVSRPHCEECKNFWRGNNARAIDYSTVETNDPALDDLVDGIAQVNTTLDDKKRKDDLGSPILYTDVVKCVFQDGHWQVKDIITKSTANR